MRVVTTYIPWRHHAPADPLRGAGAYDFDGATQPNRDVRGFLRICEELDLLVIAKPGPFVHAELRYGGLPDYVDPSLRPEIEPERSGSGEPFRWTAPGGEQARALPAPLGGTFCAYVEDWLSAVAREVLVPFSAPSGPIVGVQVLNEGIYSDSSSGLIPNYGYSVSSGRAWARFLASAYADLGRYNALHGSAWTRWEDVPAPAAVAPARDLASMLTYLDRSRFAQALCEDVLRLYVGYLHQAGLDRDLPILMNFAPNSVSYRRHVASNDGWYSKVAWHAGLGVQWGHTDWIGVAEHDPRAFLQYVLTASRERGPNLEENWGFSDLYHPAYAFTQPSYFQSFLALAAGATGLNIYTLVGTNAWREDHNINTVGIPTVPGAPAVLAGDYPGHAPIASDGRLTPKFWTVAQIAHHLSAEGASLVGDRRSEIAWGVYPPYAWAGAWAPSGDEDAAPWLAAGLRAMPHVTFRGLEAFLESALEDGMDVTQVDLLGADDAALAATGCLVLSSYEFMDAMTQARLVRFVLGGGTLVLTGLLPTRDEHLALSADHPLRRELFDHSGEEFVPIARDELRPIHVGTSPLGVAAGWMVQLDPPRDAIGAVADEAGHAVGYAVERGAGTAIYLGFNPWYTAVHGDDPRLVAAGRLVLPRVLERWTRVRTSYARALGDGAPASDVQVWQYGAFQRGRLPEATRERAHVSVEHVVVVARAPTPGIRDIELTLDDGSRIRCSLALVPHTVCLVSLEGGRARSLLLKCVNDDDGVAIPPYLREPGGEWRASAPCDLCVTRPGPDTVEILVAQAARDEVEVELPLRADRVLGVEDGTGRPVRFEPTKEGVRIHARDIRAAGVHRVRLKPQPELTRRAREEPAAL